MGFEVFSGSGGGGNNLPAASEGGFAIFSQPKKKERTQGINTSVDYSEAELRQLGLPAASVHKTPVKPVATKTTRNMFPTVGVADLIKVEPPRPVDRTGLANFIAEKQAEMQGPSILDRIGEAINNSAPARKLADIARPYQLDPNNPADLAEMQRREGNLALQPGEVPALTLGNFKRRMDRAMRDTVLPNVPVSDMPSTGNKYVDFGANLLGMGLGFAVPGGAGADSLRVGGAAANTPRLLSQENKLARLASRGAVAGGTYGAAQGFGEGMSPSDTSLNMLENAALFGTLEAGLPVLGKAIKSFRNTETPLIKSLDLTRRGALEVAPSVARPPLVPFNTGVPDYAINNARSLETGKGFSGRTDFQPPVINRSGGQVSTIPALGGRSVRSGAANLTPEEIQTILQSPERSFSSGSRSFSGGPADYALNKGSFKTGKEYSSVPNYGYPSNYMESPARSVGTAETLAGPSVTVSPVQMSGNTPKLLRTPDRVSPAMDELQRGIEEAQNYVRHNDVLAAFKPGTTVEEAYASIKANTGIDLPQLITNVEKAIARPGLKQAAQQQAQYASLRRAAGLGPEKIGRTGQPTRTLGKMNVQNIEQQFPLPFKRVEEPLISTPKSFESNRTPPRGQRTITEPVAELPLAPNLKGRMVAGKFVPFAKAEGKGDFATGKAGFSTKPLPSPVELPSVAESLPVTVKPVAPRLPIKPPSIGGQKARRFPLSIGNSQMASPALKKGVLGEVKPGGRGTYTPVTLKGVDAEAKAMVNKDTEGAVRYVLEGNEPSALHTATGIRLIEKFQNAGNYERAVDVSMSLAEKLTKQGQAISAARIVGALSPDGILRFAAREINKINNAPRLKIPGLTKDAKITPDAAQDLKRLAEIMQSATGDAKIEAAQELQAAISALKPASIGQKLATTQTIGQLYNLKTQARNILGNELFYRLERLNKYVATPIDWTLTRLTGKERTVTFSTAGQGGYWEGLLKGMKAGWKGVNVRGLQTQFDLGRTPSFKAGPGHNPAERFMSFLERSLGAVMKGFDHAAYNRAYNQTLGELATLKALNTTGKADKASVQRIMAEMDTNLMDIADQYGRYVTFQDENLISKGLQTIKRGLNVGQDFGIGDLVLKYPRTPGALLARALEYSPAGIFRAGWQIGKPLLNKQRDNREALLALSRVITGTTGLTGMGYFLADVGIITGKGSDDPDVRELEKQTGQGPYKVNISALTRWAKSGFNRKAAETKPGDTLITYDWAQPIAIALAAGANVNQSLKNNKEPLSGIGQTIYEGIESGTETIAEQPVLQGVKRLFTSYPGEEMGVMRKVGETLSEGPASFVPTLLNQVRTSLDNTGRLTYDPSLLQRGINKAAMKVPGLAAKLPPAYTTLGQKKEIYQDGSNTGFNVFVNPAFVSQYKPSPEAQKVIDVYRNTGETSQVPRLVPKKITVSGQDFTLSGPEYAEYQRLVGEYTRQGFAGMSEITDHQAAAKYMQSIITDANTRAKAEILKARGEKVYKKGNGLAIWKE